MLSNLPPGVTDAMCEGPDWPVELRSSDDDVPVDEWMCDWCDAPVGWHLCEDPWTGGDVGDWHPGYAVPDGQVWCADCYHTWEEQQQ